MPLVTRLTLLPPLVFCTAPRPDYVKVKLLYRSIRNFCFFLVFFCALVFCCCFFWEIPLGSGRYVDTNERNKARTKRTKKNKNSKRIRRSSQKMPQGTEKIKLKIKKARASLESPQSRDTLFRLGNCPLASNAM